MSGARHRRAHAGVLLALLAAATVWPQAGLASGMQRMLLAPAACRVLPPGATADASAYCLDQSRQPPTEGAILASVPASFDAARVEIADGRSLSLAEALARHVVEIEGGGSDRLLHLKNTSVGTVQICVDGPTVVMGNGEANTRDIAALRDAISRLVPEARESESEHAHAETQRKLWEAVNAARSAARQQAAQDLLAPSPAPRDKSGAGASSPTPCARGTETDDVRLCVQ